MFGRSAYRAPRQSSVTLGAHRLGIRACLALARLPLVSPGTASQSCTWPAWQPSRCSDLEFNARRIEILREVLRESKPEVVERPMCMARSRGLHRTNRQHRLWLGWSLPGRIHCSCCSWGSHPSLEHLILPMTLTHCLEVLPWEEGLRLVQLRAEAGLSSLSM